MRVPSVRRPLSGRRPPSRRAWPGWARAVGLALLVVGIASAGDDDRPSAGAARPTWDDPTQTLGDRSRRALDAANALDEQAQRAPSVAEGRARWLEASQLLDAFVARTEPNPLAGSLRFQAGVYLWARARAWLDQVDLLGPTEPDRVEVARGLDEAVDRLRQVVGPAVKATDPFGQNARFRLAQALADRARLEEEASPARVALEKEAQGLLDRSLNAPRLRSFARLLHAELSNRLGEFGPAQVEVEEAEKFKPPPPLIALTEAKINALAGRGEFGDASGVADRAAVPAELKALWKLRIALARRRLSAIGRDRDATEAEIFRAAGALGDQAKPEAARGLMELARAVDAPSAAAPVESWELLATGRLLLREPERAARLVARAADLAGATPADRAAALRFKLGACWFQAGHYANAEAALTRVIDDPHADRPLRARAGMLRTLARGRALADSHPGATRAAYIQALEAQVRDFGDDPATGEARWLLGKIRLAGGRRDEAIDLWSRVRHGQPRWLEAQAAAAAAAIQAIEAQWTNRDLAAIRPRVEAARRQIREAADQAQGGVEAVDLGFAMGRLESIPGAGQPAAAVAIFERILRGPASEEQHRQARLGRLIALAEQNRFIEAESAAKVEARGNDFAGILATARTLDEWAAVTDNDLIRKRTGALIRLLIDPWVDPPDRAPADDRDEVRLRQVRAFLFGGELAAAKRAIARWGGPTGPVREEGLLRDLADTYFRLEAYSLAVDAERLRIKMLVAGTPAWFDARYLLALALYRSNQGKEARQVIDATSILHPDLGGGEVRSKFDRLSQKLNAD